MADDCGCTDCDCTNEDKAEELGWLNEGLCKFPDGVIAVCGGL